MRKITIILLGLAGLIILFYLALNLTQFKLISSSPNSKSQKFTYNLDSKSQFVPKTPSIDQIFSNDHAWTATLSADKVRTLIATGDMIPARYVNFQTVKKNNFKWAFEKTADFLKTGDITFVNFETPLIQNCVLTGEGMSFCGDPRHVEGLLFGGVDIVNLANNHSGNYGVEGIKSTINLLESAGILTTGISEAAFINIRGMKFAFLGYDDVSSKTDEQKIKKEIQTAKEKADVVIVAFHWGTEYVSQPTKRQKDLAHFAIDSGADLIIGNHPHWIQPVEIYKDKITTYAHGNFIFDQMWSQKTREGVVGKYTFYDKNLIDVEFFPVLIEDYAQPDFLLGNQKQVILDDMKNESLKLDKN
ncbi:MAG: CapA family protein [Patescibacteria group bacterium]|nr:CapA family protein [Patescibacteria group bacterium]